MLQVRSNSEFLHLVRSIHMREKKWFYCTSLFHHVDRTVKIFFKISAKTDGKESSKFSEHTQKREKDQQN